MRVTLLREIPEDPSLRHQWNELVLREKNPQVFYTYEWAMAVQNAYSQILHPLVFLGYDDSGTLCALVALAKQGNQVSFLCATTGDYCDFLGSAEEKVGFISAVLFELRKEGLEQITLTNLPGDTGTIATLRRMSSRRGYQFFERRAYECAQVSLALCKTEPAGNRHVLPGERKLHRSLKWLSREHKVSFDHVRDSSQIEALLPAFVQMHVARFVGTGRISSLAHDARRQFVQELAKLLSQSGWLVLSRMLANGRTIAWNYGFDFAGSWFWYQPTLDSDFEKYSPGYCLLAKIVQEAAAEPSVNTVDLGLGAEEYKETFANLTRKTFYVTLSTSLARHAWEIFRYQAAESAKALPKVETGLRVARARLRNLREQMKEEGIAPRLVRLLRHFSDLVYSRTEVLFYEANTSVYEELANNRLIPLDLNSLGMAVTQYVDDPQTCTYLLRSAQRLRRRSAEGFGLVAPDGTFLHFAWVADLEGFFAAELNSKVAAPSPDCVTIFDCWTPAAVRGQGYYGQTLSLVAQLLQRRGKRAWIFVAARNTSSIRGLEKTAVQRKYSLVQTRILGWQRIHRQSLESVETLRSEVSAQV